MSLKDKIEALGEDVSADVKAILHELATFAGFVAPVAEAIEAVTDPAAVAPTEAAAKVAEVVAEDTSK